MYAYVDETGNTGKNLFDEVQPNFYLGALVCRDNFDLSYKEEISKICAELGVATLHANELGFQKIEKVAGKILRVLSKSRSSFIVSKVEKKYILATKIFDTFFDSGENAAVAWHHYNFRPLRLMLTFKFAVCLNEAVARRFWACLLAPKLEAAYAEIPLVCEDLLKCSEAMPDRRAREVIQNGLRWAVRFPRSIQLQNDRKIALRGHFPNMIGFMNLLDGLTLLSKQWEQQVREIVHDEQGEFEDTMRLWHEMYSKAAPDEIRWAGEVFSVQKVPGSVFRIGTDATSVGIQCVDLILWLFRRWEKSKELGQVNGGMPKGCRRLLQYLFSSGHLNDFSFSGVDALASRQLATNLNSDMSAEQIEFGKKMVAEMEERRRESMARYETDEVPPFARD
jgi:hypothetical protein